MTPTLCHRVQGTNSAAPLTARAEQGISLVMVLIALALMSLAAVGMIRMVDTGTLVVGNLAFKQSTTSAADRSSEAAVTWLAANNTSIELYENMPDSGYYATSLNDMDVTGKSTSNTRVLVDWDDDDCAYGNGVGFAVCAKPTAAAANNGYSTQYIVMRMCKATGDPNATGNGCAKPVTTVSSATTKRGELKYGEDKRFTSSAGPYFRIVVRSEGPRKTVSFTESYVHF